MGQRSYARSDVFEFDAGIPEPEFSDSLLGIALLIQKPSTDGMGTRMETERSPDEWT